MSQTYRPSRAIEASIIDYLSDCFETDWSNIYVGLSNAEEEGFQIPGVVVALSDTTHENVEMGSQNTYREALVFINIYATSNSQRLDIKDYVVSKIKLGCPYYTYIINNGSVNTRTETGRLKINIEGDSPVDFNIDKNDLPLEDRFRHLITILVRTNKVES